MPDGAIGVQGAGAIVLSAGQLTDDMVLIQIVTPGVPLSGLTLGALKAYVTGRVRGLVNDAGFLMLDGPQPGWPTSSAGLPAGSFYANGLFVSVTPGGVPSGVPLFFANVTAASLLAGGTGPVIAGADASSGELFINGGFVCVSL